MTLPGSVRTRCEESRAHASPLGSLHAQRRSPLFYPINHLHCRCLLLIPSNNILLHTPPKGPATNYNPVNASRIAAQALTPSSTLHITAQSTRTSRKLYRYHADLRANSYVSGHGSVERSQTERGKLLTNASRKRRSHSNPDTLTRWADTRRTESKLFDPPERLQHEAIRFKQQRELWRRSCPLHVGI